MNKRPLFALLAVAVAAIAVFVFILPSRSAENPSSANSPIEGTAQLNPKGGVTNAKDTSGVTTPPEAQPELEIKKLAPGEKPPQFVVVSFDGGVESKTGIMQHYLDIAKQVDGRFSFFVSGVYLLPDNKTKLNYAPPKKPRGTSAIGFGDPNIIEERINKLSDAYKAGNEIGTHFNGHFCGPGGVGSWSAADWTSEINQFNTFVNNWRAFNPQAANAGPLPFDASVVKGGRTPCLEGNRPAMYKAFKDAGYRYDTSGGGSLVWPKQMKNGLWNIPLQAIKVAGMKYGVLSMDYNFLANQNAGKITASSDKCQQIEDDTYNAYNNALRAVNDGNRAPLILGNHMNEWVCGAYKKALSRFIVDTHERDPDVRFISTLDLVNWMEAQDPAVLAELQKRSVAKE